MFLITFYETQSNGFAKPPQPFWPSFCPLPQLYKSLNNEDFSLQLKVVALTLFQHLTLSFPSNDYRTIWLHILRLHRLLAISFLPHVGVTLPYSTQMNQSNIQNLISVYEYLKSFQSSPTSTWLFLISTTPPQKTQKKEKKRKKEISILCILCHFRAMYAYLSKILI